MRNVAWTVGTNMAALRTLKISWWIEAEIDSNLFGTLRWVRTHPNEMSASDTEHAVVFGNHVRIHVCQCDLRGWWLKVNGFRRNPRRLRHRPLRCIALKNL